MSIEATLTIYLVSCAALNRAVRRSLTGRCTRPPLAQLPRLDVVCCKQRAWPVLGGDGLG
ncbi:hypothetical protein AN931_23270 [Mycobacterium intracellulare subsp. chimaera]|uniref:hypothetical protein n=1 Tax=Mycobacterium TaxID=1763 RepID=UPI0006420751|nr:MULTISPECIES: hypothetical protein [Mycobacterium]AOS95129.1 hypothetical protein AN480_29205 [Mycobacterium intracellulare subsp. chimaera]KLO34064.1 hypothetical protein ABW17_27125 [Mycobacterium nebraskense]KPN48670.1 hypothetical protein AN931_23270 [Mycobacterium intracellulare subsp. chimaera]